MSNQGWHAIRPRTGALEASAFVPPAVGGEVDPVSAPTPTSEAVAAGGSPTAKTFSAFTDTGGRINSYTAAIVTVSGTLSLSGSGLGPYTVSGSTDGDAWSIYLTALDVDGSPLANAVHTVRIASPSSGGAWAEISDIDFTAADTLSGINSGTLAVTTDSGATPLCSIVVDPSSTAVHTAGITNGVGLVLTAPSNLGRITAAVDLADLLGITAQQMVAGILCVQMTWTNIDCDASNDVIRGAVGVGTDAGDGTAKGGFRYIRASGTTVTPTTILDGANTTWGAAISTPTVSVVSLYVVGGRDVYVVYDASTSTLPSPSLTHMLSGRSVGVTAAAAADGSGLPLYDGSPLYAQVCIGASASVVCPRIRISAYS